MEQASAHPSGMYQPIEDYAVIGDLHTVALVGKNGSIDWCCLPRFDSPSVFGALLDVNKGGFFRTAPPDAPGMGHKQLYLPETNMLITRFLTVDGVGEITDFMPVKHKGSSRHQHHIIRSVKVVRGSMAFELVCRPAFNYARDPHEIRLSKEGAIFLSESCCIGLASPVQLEEDGQGGVRARFTLHEGHAAHFLIESAEDSDLAPQRLSHGQYHEAFLSTIQYWRRWLSQCKYHGRWRETVQRSALVLKLLTYEPTGAIVAAPTTSLPETISYDLWQNLRRLLEWLAEHWQEPDEGIWEVRGGPKRFVHSRLMSWVAFDRALRLTRHRGLPAPMGDWMQKSAEIYEQNMYAGWNEKKQSFVQYYGSDAVDASALLMVITNFAGPTDPRILNTIDRIQKELTSDSLVHRYDPKKAADDGMGSTEGTFNAASFWLAESLARAGRLDDARLMLEKMLTYSNHVGLYAEEIGTVGEALGNYPQAFTHLSLITACYNVDQMLNRSRSYDSKLFSD